MIPRMALRDEIIKDTIRTVFSRTKENVWLELEVL